MSDSGSGSDIEMASNFPKKTIKKPPSSPNEHLQREPKKLTTKEMIHSALQELNTRKGVSLHAIKKYMVEKYSVNTDKINYYIKKYIKNGVETGTIVQTKGIGASGSFKLAPNKKTEKKTKKKVVKKMEKSDKVDKKDKSEKPKKKTESSEKVVKKVSKKSEDKTTKKKESTKSVKEKEKKVKITKESKVTNEGKSVKISKTAKKSKTTKNSKMAPETPAKKRAKMMKRKSIGSIIKPPKMKPKNRV